MRKKILLAEQSDATRNVAETILRQNGFDVIAVTNGAAAVEVIENGHPDLILVSAELTHQNKPVYLLARESSQAQGKPVLVFANAGRTLDGVSSELTIPRPFNPRDFLDKVTIFVGRHAQVHTATAAENPLDSLDDDLIDSALGIGSTGTISITESEVMNKTKSLSPGTRDHSVDDFGKFQASADDDEFDRTGRVESILITDDHTDIRRPDTVKTKRPAPEPSATGGLDILSDQYGLTDPGSLGHHPADGQANHDYNWFVNEMQKEAVPPPARKSSSRPATPDTADDLEFTDPATAFESSNPSEYVEAPPRAKKGDASGVERFIDEFKKEIEKLHTDEPESLTLRDETPAKAPAPKWEEIVESVTADKVSIFTRQLAAELAERIAAKLVEKIDPNKLAHLIKAEIIAHLQARKDR